MEKRLVHSRSFPFYHSQLPELKSISDALKEKHKGEKVFTGFKPDYLITPSGDHSSRKRSWPLQHITGVRKRSCPSTMRTFLCSKEVGLPH
jgi:hypothetical protein